MLGRPLQAWTRGQVNDAETMLAFDWTNEGLDALSLWRRRTSGGAACFAAGEALRRPLPAAALDALRTLLVPTNWSIASRLLRGPASRDELQDSVRGKAAISWGQEDEDGRDALPMGAVEQLVGAGLVRLDNRGYHLTPTKGVLWAALVQMLCAEDLSRIPIGLFSGHMRSGRTSGPTRD